MKKFATFAFIAVMTLSACKNKSQESTETPTAITASQEAESFVVDTNQSVIEWVGSKPLGKHNGTIKLAGGNVFVKDGVPESGNFTIDINSITVLDLKSDDGKEDLEAHLKGTNSDSADDFFNSRRYPEGRFEITKVTPSDSGKAVIEGNLTLKETTKNIKFPATVTINGNSLTMKTDTFTIDRTWWNINYGSKSIYTDLGDKFINDDITLTISVVATK